MKFFKKIKEKFTKSENINYEEATKKQKSSFVSGLKKIFVSHRKVDEVFFEDLEDLLILSDFGFETTTGIVDHLRNEAKISNILTADKLSDILIDWFVDIYGEIDKKDLNEKIEVNFLVGVNGNGKTTTISKLAYMHKNNGKKVLLVAADTFRAGAVEQLNVHGKNIGVEVFGESGSDPASVIYKAIEYGEKNKFDVILCDTSGRLHTKTNLMSELEKMVNVAKKFNDNYPYKTFLVLDSTTGQNGLTQAVEFKKYAKIDSVILTKIDSTAKGGIIFSVKNKLGLNVEYICFGEKKEDISEFDIQKYLYTLFKDFFNNEEN